MRRIGVAILLLAMAGGGFYALAWFGGSYMRAHSGSLPPVLAFLSTKNDITDELLRGLGVLILGPAITFFIWTVITSGSNKGRKDPYLGITTLRLKTGLRLFLMPATLGIAGLFLIGVLNPSTLSFLRWGLGVLSAAFIYAALWIILARVRYDSVEMINTHWNLGQRHYAWRDLRDIRFDQDRNEVHFLYTEGRKATISTFYAGIDELTNLAFSHLDLNLDNEEMPYAGIT